MKDIFISYKSDEYNTAKWVRDYLIKCGLSVWMAPEDIPGGGSYAEHIPDAIENCKAFVMIFSPKAQDSKWVRRELDQAINNDKEILPFMIEKFELSKEFRFYLANIQAYPAYEDISGQLMEMTRKILSIPGITVHKPEEKKPVVNTAKPAPPAKKEPDFIGLGLKTEKEKLRYAVEESTRLYDSPELTPEQRNRAFELLEWAARNNDPEACFRFGARLVNGKIRLKDIDSKERGMYYIDRAAYLGHKVAQKAIDNYCNLLYEKNVGSKNPKQAPAPLRDHNGWKIKIKHTGKFTPVNAELVYQEEKNILFLDVNANILVNDEEVVDRIKFMDAVEKGFKAWEGVYTVFGGQEIVVVVNVKFSDFALLGCVNISSLKSNAVKGAIKLAGIKGHEWQNRLSDAANTSASIASIGMKKWSVRSGKSIFINNSNGRFDDYDMITKAVRSEFGSILGLADMRITDNNENKSIPKGTYPELDPYYIENGYYNLVMCNRRGVISNNDMEMVILALSENEMQHYIEDSMGHKPSKALGKGN